MLLRARDGLRAVLGLGDDLDVDLVVEDPAQAGPHERVVVGDQDSDGHQGGTWSLIRCRVPSAGRTSSRAPISRARSRIPRMPPEESSAV